MKQRIPAAIAVWKVRKDLGLTQEELAKKAGISIQYLRLIEGGYPAVSDEIKKRIAAALNYSVWSLFPEVRMEIDLFTILENRFGDDLNITEKETPIFKEVLSRLSEDQFSELIVSDMTPANLRKKIKEIARKFDIEA